MNPSAVTPLEEPAFVQPVAPFPWCSAECALLAETNHRVANQFTTLAAYIHLTLEELRSHPSEIRDFELGFLAVEAKARALASLNRLLIGGQMSSAPTDVSIILHQVCSAFRDTGNRGHVLDEITGDYLVTHSVNAAVGQIVTEAVMNALKYAYPADQGGDIVVRMAKIASGELLIEVSDHGVGLSSSRTLAEKSFGSRLMRGLARQESLGLSFVAASPGLSVQILIPPCKPM